MPSLKNKQAAIPVYNMEEARPFHRDEDVLPQFGYHRMNKDMQVKDFEIYSSKGVKGTMGPVKAAFYSVSIFLRGSIDVQLGIEHYRHQAGTVHFSFPGQVFSKSNMSADTFGYYLLFNPHFLDELLPATTTEAEFPFFSFTGIPFFQLEKHELDRVVGFIIDIDNELKSDQSGKARAVKMYVYLILLEMKRSYERQQLSMYPHLPEKNILVARFKKLVSQHFLTRRKVTDYASLLHVTANHLNRTIKEVTDKTASETIADMLLQEARALLRFTDLSVSEIAYRLQFSDPSTFNRFFKKTSGITPLAFRENA